MEKETNDKKGNIKPIIYVVIVALVLLSVIVMAVNSTKPDQISLDNVDTKIKGAAFIRTNQFLIEQIL